MATVTQVYYGTLEDMIAEVAAFDPRTIGVSAKECRYAALPVGDKGQFDTEWFATRLDAAEYARDVASNYDGCRVCRI